MWTGRVSDDYDYSYTAWGCGTRGWELAFGDMFLEELGTAIKEDKLEDEFMILQTKEKYGGLRFYTSGVTKRIHDIIDKYEKLSQNICVACGKPDVPMIYDGWYSPWCYDCWKRNYRSREKYSSKPKKTDEEIRSIYEECICDDDPLMADTMTFKLFSKDGDTVETIDISETAKKIRLRWEKRHKKKLT